ncbi:MAG: thiamine pyrophosphate-binding protein [Hyphomicrobium sp.]|nr:MAG: thiamine pyrophosphate-binding protein [Hyphomicrobium sp.]PPC99792.1 MAG: thiamine pyrophosphate-binding protein [Hyphomicrobium sp.]
MPTGGEILVHQLASEGVKHLFTVPGESFISVLDAIHSDHRIRPITCRNESGAAMMAEATGKLTGIPGVAIVTRGPGAANAFAGVYVAAQDASPMVLLVGLPSRAMAERPSFQAIELQSVFASLAKWIAIIPNAASIPEFVSRAFRTARFGRPGPVVLGVPEDMLSETTDVVTRAPAQLIDVAPSAAQLLSVRDALAQAERPLLIVGGLPWSPSARADLVRFAEKFDLPVACAFRRQDHFDNRHRCYVGHAGLSMDAQLVAGIRAADCVIAIGTRLGDITTLGFTLLHAQSQGQRLIHVASDAGDPDSAYTHALQISASSIAAVEAFADLETQGMTPKWGIWRRDLRAAYVASTKPQPTPGRVQLEDVVTELSERLPETAIISNGAGNYAAFLHRYFTYKSYPTQLAPISGSMGYGLPAAVAAKLAYPDTCVVALAGDGCFQMTGQELATAVQYGLPIVLIIANNRALGTIRMHQERQFPGRVVATSLINPDFVALAKSYGAAAKRITATEQFPEAFRSALNIAETTQRPVVIELDLDIEAISPRETITDIRSAIRNN